MSLALPHASKVERVELIGAAAAAIAEGVRSGEVDAVDVTRACLARIDEAESEVQAWAHLDRDFALAQAQRADDQRRAGRSMGMLQGVPIGIKDIFDTLGLPTENGTVLHAGRRPLADAAVVTRLRAAGAVIVGKTVTTELAVYAPGKTRNPHDTSHTPGGSSSGSAAAVAAGMVPVAVGSQTNGSVIRPAAYCGVFGFKPSYGLISRAGVLRQSPPLDHVGLFARNLHDLALLTEALAGFDEADTATRLQATPPMRQVLMQEPPLTPRLAFIRTPVWEQADAATQAAFGELVEHLGDDVGEVGLAELFDNALDWHRTIMESDLALSFAREYVRGADKLSATLREMIERGQIYSAVDYNRALRGAGELNELMGLVFDEFDAVITPAATGEAPSGLESTGNPAFCTLWTLCGLPAITLPVFEGAQGLPMGVQLVGARGDDARLLRTARWLLSRLESEQDE